MTEEPMTGEETFPPVLNHIEQFLALFDSLKDVAGDEPKRLATFYSQSSAVREAAEKLQECELDLKYNLEWFGRKRLGPIASRFKQAWAEYQDQWAPAIAYGSLCERIGKRDSSQAAEFRELNPYNSDFGRALTFPPKQEEPDPDRDAFFDPVRHDGGDALALGVDHWRNEVHRAKLIANKCQIALNAFDYLMDPIGIDVSEIFRRWRKVPPIFIPPAVSNKHGGGRGSLNDLLDSAVRAYVCGADVASVTLCRAILDLVLEKHYLPEGRKKKNGHDMSLDEIISFVGVRYDFVDKTKLREFKKFADNILHNKLVRENVSEDDEEIVVDFIVTLKTIIQNVQK